MSKEKPGVLGCGAPENELPPTYHDDDLLSNDEAADYLDISGGTLEVWRCTKRYVIPYIKVGRNVRYRKISLDKFLSDRTVER